MGYFCVQPEVVNKAAEYRLRAERRLGEILKGTERAQGRRTDLVPERKEVEGPPTLEEVGISRKLSSRAQRVAGIPEESV